MHIHINSRVLAVSIAAALSISLQAHAETTVYGKIHLSAGLTTSEEISGDITSTQVKSHASRVGFKSDKALDNGMTVVGQLEYEVDSVGDSTKSSTDLIKARNSFFGLKGGFGEVRAGIHDLPSKISTGDLDPFADTYADYNNVLMADDRGSNTVMYLNKLGGFDIALSYSASKTDKDTPTATTDNIDAMNSAMINYTTPVRSMRPTASSITVTPPRRTKASIPSATTRSWTRAPASTASTPRARTVAWRRRPA